MTYYLFIGLVSLLKILTVIERNKTIFNKKIHAAIICGATALILVFSSSNMVFAAGLASRVERRVDVRQNTGYRADDKQDTRLERRDCTGEGADCRSDNRQDKRSDALDRAEDRVDDRQDRR